MIQDKNELISGIYPQIKNMHAHMNMQGFISVYN